MFRIPILRNLTFLIAAIVGERFAQATDMPWDAKELGLGVDSPGAAVATTTPTKPPTPPISVTAAVKAGIRFLSDPLVSPGMEELGSEARAEVALSGRITPQLGFRIGILGQYGEGLTPNDSRLALYDVIAKVEPIPEANLWIGRLPIVSDRASLGDQASALAWTPVGVFSRQQGETTLRRGDDFRGTGVTVFGNRGRWSYYLGGYDPRTIQTRPLVSGRLALTVSGEETGFWRPASYFGTRNVFALALFAQYQPDGSVGRLPQDDFLAFGGDLFLERGNASAGTFLWDVTVSWREGRNELLDLFASSQVGYLLPPVVGSGRLYTLLRGQLGRGRDEKDSLLLDAQLGYAFPGANARVLAMYQYGNIPAGDLNLVLVGLRMATE